MKRVMKQNGLCWRKRGQEKILADFASILVFIIAVIAFWAIIQSISASSDAAISQVDNVVSSHRALISFARSDYQGTPAAAILATGDDATIKKMVTAYFTPVFAQQWQCSIAYRNGKNGIDIGPGSSPSSLTFVPGTWIPVSYSAKKVIVTQVIPAPDGTPITMTLTTWW